MSYLGRSAKLSLKAQEKVSFLATAGQTVKTNLSYTPSFIEVYVNGVLLTDTTDYTATNGNSVTFTVALLLNDEVTVISLKTFTVADHYNKTEADTLLAAKATNTALATTNTAVALKAPIASPSFTGNVGVTGTNAAVNVICGGVTEDSNLNFVQGSTTEGGITYDHNSGYASEQMNFRVGNNTTHMSINGAGIVTKPNQPCFRAGLSTSTSTSTNSIIVFNTVASSNFGFNQGNHYSTSTGRFTAPVAGVYCFSSGVLFEGVATNTDMAESLYLYRNGAHNAYSVRRANYVSNVTGNSGYYGDYLHSELDLAAGDYITIISRHAETTHGNAKYTFFQGHLIG